jgi:hypothetical protein
MMMAPKLCVPSMSDGDVVSAIPVGWRFEQRDRSSDCAVLRLTFVLLAIFAVLDFVPATDRATKLRLQFDQPVLGQLSCVSRVLVFPNLSRKKLFDCANFDFSLVHLSNKLRSHRCNNWRLDYLSLWT